MDFNGKKVAVARFSRPGMNWVSGSIVPLKVGNTAKLADVIAEETGGSVYAIEPAAAYPDDYRACTDQAAKELKITQPSLSHAMSALEEELGTRLFEKRGRNVVLTKYGKVFQE